MGAIYLEAGLAQVNQDECVECSTCYRFLPSEGLPPALVRLARRAIALAAHILNCSFGIPGVPVTLPVYKAWTDQAFTSGRHVVAASSNSDPDEPHWPASFAQVLSVTSAELPPDVLRHRPGRLVSFEASGVKVPVLTRGGGTSTLTGSSFAAAHLSGLLARLLSRHPNLSPAFAQEALRGVAANEHAPGTQPSD